MSSAPSEEEQPDENGRTLGEMGADALALVDAMDKHHDIAAQESLTTMFRKKVRTAPSVQYRTTTAESDRDQESPAASPMLPPKDFPPSGTIAVAKKVDAVASGVSEEKRKKWEQVRLYILQELLETEKNYVNNLEAVLKLFK